MIKRNKKRLFVFEIGKKLSYLKWKKDFESDVTCASSFRRKKIIFSQKLPPLFIGEYKGTWSHTVFAEMS